MVAIFETVENGKSIIKGLSEIQAVYIHEQLDDTEKNTITVVEKDEDTGKNFTNIFLKQHIVKVTIFKEE